MKQSARVERRKNFKKATPQETKPSSSLKTRRRKRRGARNKARVVIKDHYLSEESGTAAPKDSSEERKEMHRVHERLRHQSLNGAIKELVEILPAGDASRSVTKYNVLQKADNYIDFLQHKITCLCLEMSIEHKTQDGRFSFSVPFSTIVGGEQLKIPPLTPISPHTLRGIHKSAKNVPHDQLEAGMFAGEQTKKTSPARRCRFKLKKKSPKTKKTNCVNQKSNVRPRKKDMWQTATASSPPERLSEDIPVEVPSNSDRGDLAIYKKQTLKSDLSSLVIGECFSLKPAQLPKNTSFASNISYRTEKSDWPKKVAREGESLSAAVDWVQRKKLLDSYINVDSLPDALYGIPPKAVEVLPPASIPGSNSNLLDLETLNTVHPFNATPRPLQSDHSYSTSFLPAFTSAGLPNDVVLMGADAPIGPEESTQAPFPETANTQAVMPSQRAILCPTNDPPSVLSPTLYVHQPPISHPIKSVTQESSIISTTLGYPSTAAPARQTRASVPTSSCKSTLRFVPIQPATSAPTNAAVGVAYYGATSASSLLLQNNQAMVASAQKLVADPHCLYLEDSDSSLEISCDNGSASSACPMRRSWINGYQLFTKVNHPRFREKWPRLQGREITRLLSQAWKELPPNFKRRYSQRAREWNQWHRSKREAANRSREDI